MFSFDTIDIDECSNNQHDCNHICGNIVGSFNCSCHNGFILQPDGRTCEGNKYVHSLNTNKSVHYIYLSVYHCWIHSWSSFQLYPVDPNRICQIDNNCEDLCVLEITEDSGSGSGSGLGNVTPDEVCFCVNGFVLDDNMENCTGECVYECGLICLLACMHALHKST